MECKIRINYLKCHVKEDNNAYDEPRLKIVIDGSSPFNVRVFNSKGKNEISEGETIYLDWEYSFTNYIQIEVFDNDYGTWFDSHDFIGRVVLTPYSESKEDVFIIKGDGARYELSYSLFNDVNDVSDSNNNNEKTIIGKILEQFKKNRDNENFVWRSYDRSVVYTELYIRMIEYVLKGVSYRDSFIYYPCQGRTMLCGPAAIAYELMRTYPVDYVKAVLSLYEVGICYINGLSFSVTPYLRTSYKPDDNMYFTDWMFMGALRLSRNGFYKKLFYGGKSSGFASFTPPEDISYWLRRIFPHDKVKTLLRLWRNESDKTHWRAILRAAGGKNRSFFLIDGAIINGKRTKTFIHRFHWIVVEPGTFKVDNNMVRFDYYTWGEIRKMEIKKKDLIKDLYSIIVRE